jgi:hypothetical protein
LSCSRKYPPCPQGGNFCHPEGRGETFISDNSKCIFRTSEGGTGTNVEFPLWGGMDLFWNNPGVKKWGQEMYSCTKHERFLKYGSN